MLRALSSALRTSPPFESSSVLIAASAAELSMPSARPPASSPTALVMAFAMPDIVPEAP